ncbi:MAG: hypothetical protein IJ167_10620 [Lachnospiraceae bacterium]|nr:hypothetical protein [Lachnospiraceae bacterium]
MKIKVIDNVVFADYNELKVNNMIVNQIANHTVETWQPDRKSFEKGSNTRQGKIAEEIVEFFWQIYFGDYLFTKSYDEIRNDNYKKHAPFDFLIWKSAELDITPIEKAIRNDIDSTNNEFVKLSEYTRDLCKKKNVKIVEVKSTKIRDELKTQAHFEGDYKDTESVKKLISTIKRKDDVFCYPYYKRSETNHNYNFNDYCIYVKSMEPSLTGYDGEELKSKVLDIELEKQCCDIFVRVYLDSSANIGFVFGWMKRENLLDNEVIFKRMPKNNKSEDALYFTKNLQKAESIVNLPILFGSDGFVYANPFTSTNFYHKNRDCRYLSRVMQCDLIVYRNENEAVSSGRFSQRCRDCFV